MARIGCVDATVVGASTAPYTAPIRIAKTGQVREPLSFDQVSRFSVRCSSNFDCMGVCGKPVCKQLLKGGTKTCEPTSSCSGSKPKKKTTKDGEMTTQTQKRCKNEQFCDSTNKCQMDIEDSCGTNNDCMNLNIDKRFCLNSGLTKHCVPKRPCKVHCTDLQICDKRENTCKDPSMKSFRISINN